MVDRMPVWRPVEHAQANCIPSVYVPHHTGSDDPSFSGRRPVGPHFPGRTPAIKGLLRRSTVVFDMPPCHAPPPTDQPARTCAYGVRRLRPPSDDRDGRAAHHAAQPPLARATRARVVQRRQTYVPLPLPPNAPLSSGRPTHRTLVLVCLTFTRLNPVTGLPIVLPPRPPRADDRRDAYEVHQRQREDDRRHGAPQPIRPVGPAPPPPVQPAAPLPDAPPAPPAAAAPAPVAVRVVLAFGAL